MSRRVELIVLAILAIQKKEISLIREAARRFNVPATSLGRRLAGYTSLHETRANSRKLTRLEEDILLQWILSID